MRRVGGEGGADNIDQLISGGGGALQSVGGVSHVVYLRLLQNDLIIGCIDQVFTC